jgi:hypothetical protein
VPERGAQFIVEPQQPDHGGAMSKTVGKFLVERLAEWGVHHARGLKIQRGMMCSL